MTDDTWTPEQYRQYMKTGATPRAELPRSHQLVPAPTAPPLELLAKARTLARQHGWQGYGHTDPATDEPELILVRPGEMLVLLFKGPRAKLTLEQTIWHSLLESVPGIEPTIVQPQTWAHLTWRLTQPGKKTV